MSESECNNDVFKHGASLGFFDMSKEQAEAYCKAETERTGHLHDWHYVGGRVHVKCLPPNTPTPITDEEVAQQIRLVLVAGGIKHSFDGMLPTLKESMRAAMRAAMERTK